MSDAMQDFRLAALGASLTAFAFLAAPAAFAQAPQYGAAEADSTTHRPGGDSLGTSAPRGPSGGVSPSPPTGTQTPARDRTDTTRQRNDPNQRSKNESDWNRRSLWRPVVLVGRVLTDSGQPPPDRVLVGMDCGGGARPQGYTDAKGRFSFEPNGDRTLLASDASVPSRALERGPIRARTGRINPFIAT